MSWIGYAIAFVIEVVLLTTCMGLSLLLGMIAIFAPWPG